MSLKEKIESAIKQKSKVVPFNRQTQGYCQCVDCPTHEQCEEDEKVFCSVGESMNSATMAHKSCMCSTCEVFARYNLSGGYFCIEGEAE